MEARTEPTKTEQSLELLVFLLLIVPSIALSVLTRTIGQSGFVLLAMSTIFRNLALVALILFFLWRNGEAASLIGWTRTSIRSNLTLGFFLAPLVTGGVALLAGSLETLGLSGPSADLPSFLRPRGEAEVVLAVIMVTIIAVSEETIFRGYLIARIKSTTGSLPLALILSTAVFALGHAYEGAAGMIAVGVMGLSFALLLVWRRSLVAPVVIHFINNFLAIVVAPLFLN